MTTQLVTSFDAAPKDQLKNDWNSVRFRCHERRNRAGLRTYDVVESDAGNLQWLVAKNSEPLIDDEMRGEWRWLDRVLTEPTCDRERSCLNAETA